MLRTFPKNKGKYFFFLIGVFKIYRFEGCSGGKTRGRNTTSQITSM